jgi:hypothetical protein
MYRRDYHVVVEVLICILHYKELYDHIEYFFLEILPNFWKLLTNDSDEDEG